MTKIKYIFFLFIALSVSLSAQEYAVKDVPNPKTADATHFVSNPDRILNNATVEQINALLQSLETDTEAEVAVVMLNSIGSEDIFDFGVQLFAQWGIGKKDVDNGLLILFVLDQRAIRFEVGYGLEGVLTDGICKRIQTQAMIPEFKNGDYDAGILAGVEQAVAYIRQEPLPEKNNGSFPPLKTNTIVISIAVGLLLTGLLLVKENQKFRTVRNDLSLTDNPQRYEAYVNTKLNNFEGCMYVGVGCLLPLLGIFFLFAETFFGLVLLSGLLIFIPLGIYQSTCKKKLRQQPVACPCCGKEIKALPEKEISDYLNPQQNLENTLRSVYVDVFLCEDCNKTIVYKYDNSASKYKKCPQCETKAMYLAGTKTITHATYTSGGEVQETYMCKYCQHQETKNKATPHLTRSSSGSSSSGGGSRSSGGSFGGGRSGGGGSTSRW